MAKDKTKYYKDKHCILIIGMHRTGTSFISRYLSKLGISAGDNLMGPSFDNPYGFFEHNDIVALNDSILNSLGCKWDEPFVNDELLNRSEYISQIKKLIDELLNTELSGFNHFFIKDPRISLILPMWISALSELSVSTKIIVCNRSPKEIAQSLNKRNSFSEYKSNILYIQYMLSAEKHSRNQQRLFLNFKSAFTDFSSWNFQLSEFLSEELIAQNDQIEIRDLFDKNLQSELPDVIENGNKLTGLSDELYKILSKQNRDSKQLIELTTSIANRFQSHKQNLFEWTHRNYFGKILFYSENNNLPDETINFKVVNGLNSISLDVEAKNISKITLFPIHSQAIVMIHQLSIDGKEQDWINNSGYKNDDQVLFDVEFPSINLIYKGDIKKINLYYTLDNIGENINSQIEIVALKHNLENLNAEYLNSKLQHDADTKGLMNQIELLNLLSETEKQEGYDAYNKSLNKFRETISQSSSAYDERLLSLTSSYKEATEKHAIEISELKSKYKVDTTNLIEDFNIKKELFAKRLFDQIAENTKLKLDVDNSKLEINEFTIQISILENEIEEFKKEIEEFKKERTKTLLLVQSQHEEIQHNKDAYAHRVNELRGISNSWSYKLGQIITWPARIIYEGVKITGPLMTIIGSILGFLFVAPSKVISSISFKNITTLFKALRHESPNQILRNTRKAIGLRSTLSMISRPPSESITNWDKKSVLYISPNLPEYDTSSGGRRATKMLSLLHEFSEVYIFTLGARPEKYLIYLESLGLRVIESDKHEAVYNTLSKIDTIIFAWYYTLHDNSALLSSYDNVQVIVDTVDVHWVREERSIGQQAGLTIEKVAKNKLIELESYNHADLIWVVTEEDKKAILRELPNANIEIVSNIHEIEIKDYQPKEKNILFFGGFNHPPNISAAIFLAKEFIPKIIDTHPDVTLLIAGASAPQEIQQLGELQGVNYLGFIPEEELKNLYARSLITVAPLTAGAGIKGKICEAIAYRLPVMTTDIGNEGLNLKDGVDGFICSPEKMADRLITILDSQYDLEKVSANAQSKLLSIVGPEIAAMNMRKSLYREVSICIVTWNRLSLLKRCIESLLTNTEYPHYRILIHSNGCSDGTQEYLRALSDSDEKIVAILSDKNDVFVLPNNLMMKRFPQNDVVLLNNDTYVTKGWLGALREAAYSNQTIGITGSKILYPDGRLQEFGSELYENGTGRNIGKREDPTKKEYNKPTYVGYVSGCSMYIKRSTIDKIGYLDEQFHPCYCEDSDYAYTAWEQGIRTMVIPESVIYHDEGGTSGTNENEGFKRYQKINFEKFLRKHKSQLHSTAELIKTLNQYENN